MGFLDAEPAARSFVQLLIEGVLSGETYKKQKKENRQKNHLNKDGISADV